MVPNEENMRIKCSISNALLVMTVLFLSLNAAQINYAGARSSYYGIYPFPTGEQWKNVNNNMAVQFEGAQATALWIIGGIQRDTVKKVDYCRLEFPEPDSGVYDSITFYSYDKHEPYLSYFDTTGVKVFLQVESGDANVGTLIDLVLSRYSHHPCVAGFGVDAEWYLISVTPNTGTKVTDALAEAWDKKVKTYNSAYRLFIKHWDKRWMPPGYRSDIVFINDSQKFMNIAHMASEFSAWAESFTPSTVMFQVGYPSDYIWWKNLANPPKDIGYTILAEINDPTNKQEIGVIWVDFTLEYKEVQFLFDHIDAIEHTVSLLPLSSPLQVTHEKLSSTVSIKYALPESSQNGRIGIHSSNGSLIASYLLNSTTGYLYWRVNNAASRVYYITLSNESTSVSRKITLLKR